MNIEKLGESDIGIILDLEHKSWIPDLQATEETIKTRLSKGHTILGIKNGERLIAKICFYYSFFMPRFIKEACINFQTFSSRENELRNLSTVNIYNLDVDPDFQGGMYAVALLKAVEEQANNKKCVFIVGDGRCPSYNGSLSEGIKQNIEFKNAINAYLAGGPFPSDEELCQDRTLAFYKKSMGCVFTEILQDFIPEDEPSGGIRVFAVKNIRDNPMTLSEEWAQLSEDICSNDLAFEVARFIQSIQKNYFNFIEYGCGSGQFARQLSYSGMFNITAIENDPIYSKYHKDKEFLEFKQASWLEFTPEKMYDVAICRGNSIAYTNCWDGTIFPTPERMRDLIKRSLLNMFKSLKSGGLLYVDTITENQYRTPKEYMTINTCHCRLKGLIIHDYVNCTRQTSGKGWVNNKWFEGGAIGYLLSPLELYQMMSELNPKKIWFQKFKNETNYTVICAIK